MTARRAAGKRWRGWSAAWAVVRGVVAVGVVVGAGAGCNQDSAGGDGAPGATSTTTQPDADPTAEGTENEVEVEVTIDQPAALADGVVTDIEMAEALGATVACLADLGFPAGVAPVNADRGLSAGWTFDLPQSDTALAALAVCRAATVSELEQPYLLVGAPTAEDLAERESQIRDCLAQLGHAVDGMSLSEMFGSVDPNVVVACDPHRG